MPLFITEAQAAGYGWVMPIKKNSDYTSSQICSGRPDSDRLSRATFQIRNSENHNQSLTGNIKVINLNDGSEKTASGISSVSVDFIDPFDGVFIKVTGVSNFYDFDSGFEYFKPGNFTNSYITNRIFMVPKDKSPSVNMTKPIDQSWLKGNPTFTLNFRLAPGIGSTYVQRIYFYLFNFSTGSWSAKVKIIA